MKTNFNGNSKKSGVYKIVNIANGRIYIGSAKKFSTRLSQHLKSLNEGTHHNKFLQNNFIKCGIESFEFQIIEIVEGEQEKRLSVEQKYLDQYHDNQSSCYNLDYKTNIKSKGKNKKPRLPLSQEARDNIGKSSKVAWEKKTSVEKERLSALRKELTKNQWKNEEHRAKINASQKINSHKISAAQKAKAETKEGKEEFMRRLELARLARPPKTIEVISPEGEHITITNLYKWCRDNNMNYEGMRWITRGPNNTYKGWKTSDVNDKKQSDSPNTKHNLLSKLI